jgi:hypothetical protein
MRGFVAALALLLALSAAAQPPSPDHPAVPPELLAPNQDASTVFDALASRPLTDEVVERVIRAQSAETLRQMDELIARSFAPGELARGWQSSGVDLRAIIAARSGGLQSSMIEGASPFGPASARYLDRPIDAFVPPEWVMIGRHGAAFDGENVSIEASPLSPKIILVERIAYRRQGNAYCRMQAESRLYADPVVPASRFDLATLMMTMRALAAADHRTMCEVVESLPDGRYRFRMYDPDGHRLEGLERESPAFRIVPIGPASAPARHQ